MISHSIITKTKKKNPKTHMKNSETKITSIKLTKNMLKCLLKIWVFILNIIDLNQQMDKLMLE